MLVFLNADAFQYGDFHSIVGDCLFRDDPNTQEKILQDSSFTRTQGCDQETTRLDFFSSLQEPN